MLRQSLPRACKAVRSANPPVVGKRRRGRTIQGKHNESPSRKKAKYSGVRAEQSPDSQLPMAFAHHPAPNQEKPLGLDRDHPIAPDQEQPPAPDQNQPSAVDQDQPLAPDQEQPPAQDQKRMELGPLGSVLLESLTEERY